jgi:two-component system, OmpR family, sensor histidine kinase KdpD
MKKLVGDLLLSAATVAAISGGIAAVLSRWQVGPLAVVYILGILWLATRGRTAALLAAIEAFLVYDWFFVPPFHTLDVQQPQEWLELGIFLVVALVAGQAYALQRRQALEAAERDRHTQLLYDLSTGLTVQENLGGMFDRMLAKLAQGLGLSGLRLYVWREGARELSGGVEVASDGVSEPVTSVYRVPCRIGEHDLAEMEVFQRSDGQPLSQDDLRVLQGFANQLANALERRRLEKEEQLNQVLGEANRAKSSLLAAVSHDLRTPLAAIKASATSLLQAGADFDEGERREFLAAVNREADRLDRLVRNLLDMSRIESGALTPRLEWHNLSEIAADVVDRLQPVSDGHELQLVAEDREFLANVDYVQLSQVLTNLVDNAIRHGAPLAPIRVGVAEGRLWVENQGRQLSDEEREHIFDRFYRGEGLASGTGLGLAIAKGVVEAHGGRIWVENTAEGMRFRVELAVSEERGVPSPSLSHCDGRGTN